MTMRPSTPPVWSASPVASTSSCMPGAAPPEEQRLDDPVAVLPVRRHRVGGLPAAVAAKRARSDHLDRRAALATIVDIVARHFPEAPSIRAIRADGGGAVSPDSVSLGAMAEKKATNTLLKRASSLRMYDAWYRASSCSGGFCDEPTVFTYVRELYQDSAPASRAAAVVASLNFLEGVFAIDVLPVRASARVQGMCVRSLRTRAAIRQRRPFSVELVRVLEDVLAADGGAGTVDGVLAGAALFTIFARARVGDLRRCTVEPVLDIFDGKGYVESAFLEHKTAVPGTRKALPIVAPAFGLATPWASTWMATRRCAGLDAAKDLTMIPARAEGGGWATVPYTTVEFASSVRDLLLRHGVTADAIVNIGAHSMKTTLLSWIAKYGLDKPTRRMLGYHAEPKDKSVETYSRDAMAAPMRKLDEVLAAVRSGRFLPDANRSGHFVDDPASVHGQVHQVQRHDPGEELSRLSRGSDLRHHRHELCESKVPSDRTSEELLRLSTSRHSPLHLPVPLHRPQAAGASSSAPEGVPATSVGPPSSSSSVASPASTTSDDSEAEKVANEKKDELTDGSMQVVVNTATKTHHIQTDEATLLCRQPARRCVPVSRLPSGARLCSRCF